MTKQEKWYWSVVEGCLEEFHHLSKREAVARCEELKKRLLAKPGRLKSEPLLIYHEEPLHTAADLAGAKRTRIQSVEDAYTKVLCRAENPVPLRKTAFPEASVEKKTAQSEQMKVVKFKVGDRVRVHTRVVEGDKERVQIFTGIVIGRKGTLLNESFTVRRTSYGEGVERVFPLHSPRIAKIEVETKGADRRTKLNYLRDRKGKSAMSVREKSA